jgi:LysM repeat protein
MFTKRTIFHTALALALALPFANAATLHAQNIAVDVANMRQELDLLRQRIGQLELNVESVQRENNDLRNGAAATAKQNYATVDQLNKSIADLNRAIKDSKADTLARVKTEMDSLTKQSNAALADMAAKVNAATQRTTTTTKTAGATTTAPPVFSDNYPEKGITYTIVSGDSIATIARKTGARQQDIINANKIANPKSLMIGQVLFIPGGRDPNASTTPAPAPAPASPIAPAQ